MQKRLKLKISKTNYSPRNDENTFMSINQQQETTRKKNSENRKEISEMRIKLKFFFKNL